MMTNRTIAPVPNVCFFWAGSCLFVVITVVAILLTIREKKLHHVSMPAPTGASASTMRAATTTMRVSSTMRAASTMFAGSFSVCTATSAAFSSAQSGKRGTNGISSRTILQFHDGPDGGIFRTFVLPPPVSIFGASHGAGVTAPDVSQCTADSCSGAGGFRAHPRFFRFAESKTSSHVRTTSGHGCVVCY